MAVPYVAPMPNSLEDKRIYYFLDTVGTKECRDKIYNVQRFLLEHEAEAVSKLKWYAKGKDLSFDYFGNLETAFENWILEYSFSFWQIGDIPCDKIPTNKSVDDYLDHLIKGVGGIEFLSDKSISEWTAHHYMSATQTGYYGYDISRYKNYLHYIKGANPSAILVPKSIHHPAYDSSFMQNVSRWLGEKGNNILYIYGSTDTWSACRVIVSDKVNSKSYLIPGANHYKARIKNMPQEMQKDFADVIKRMLNLDADMGVLK